MYTLSYIQHKKQETTLKDLQIAFKKAVLFVKRYFQFSFIPVICIPCNANHTHTVHISQSAVKVP